MLCTWAAKAPPVTLNAATSAIIAAMSVPPSAARAVVINNMVLALMDAGLWTKIGLLYVCAAHDGQAGRVNWKNPGVATLTPANNPTFVADQGYKGTSSAWLDSGVAENALPLVAQDSAHYGAYGGGTQAARMLGLVSPSDFSVQINVVASRVCTCHANVGLSTAGETQVGHVVVLRRDAANQFSYKDGGAELTGAAASLPLVADTLGLLRFAANFAGTAATVHIAHCGTQLSAAEVATLYPILRAYLQAVGAV